MALISELKRRNVLRVGAAYIALAWLAVQVLDSLAPLFGVGEETARLIVILLAIGLMPVLVVSWLFEFTAEGFKRDRKVDHSSADSKASARRLDRMFMVTLVLAVVYFAVDKFVFDPARDAEMVSEVAEEARDEALLDSYGDRSIAVLPFDDTSADGSQEYLSDGIAEEIINLLAPISEIRVISRSSAFSFKGRNVPLAEIAKQLGVRYVMEGTIRLAGERLRITAQMIDPRTNTALWSENFDRQFGDVFAIQDEIAGQVVSKLEVELTGKAPSSKPVDPQAYALYLRARNLVNKQTLPASREAQRLLEQSINIDGQHAAAWVLFATIYRQLTYFEKWSMPEYALKAREALENALKADPNNTKAKAQLAALSFKAITSWAGEAQARAYAMSLEPGDPEFNANVSVLLRNLGVPAKAVEYAEYAAQRDPLSARLLRTLMLTQFAAGNIDEAIAANKQMREITGGQGGLWYLGMMHLENGDTELASEAFDTWAQSQGEDNMMAVHGHAMIHLARGEQAEFEHKLEQLQGIPDSDWPVAITLAKAGMHDEAMDKIEVMVNPPNDFGPLALNTSPMFTALHDHPRWEEVLRKRGSHPDQIAEMGIDQYFPGPGQPPTISVDAP